MKQTKQKVCIQETACMNTLYAKGLLLEQQCVNDKKKTAEEHTQSFLGFHDPVVCKHLKRSRA
jgi:hypothetical protein